MIVVRAFVPVERNHSVVVFRALPQEMCCSVYSGVEDVAFAEDHPSALVDPALA